MDKKITVLVVAVFCLLCITSYLLFEPGENISYHEINLTNSCSARVPLSDKVSLYTDNLDINYYSDYKYNLNITSFNNGSSITSSQGLLRMENIKKETLGFEKESDNGFTYYKNNNLGSYGVYVVDKRSNNHIIISSSDLSILTKVHNSLKARIIIDNDDLDNLQSNDSNN